MMDKISIPKIATDCTKPLAELDACFLKEKEKISHWFDQQWQLTKPPIYGSVDLRNAGFKLAPIDMNLFPAGFNNLNPEFFSCTIEAARATIMQLAENVKDILIIAESHTRNIFYWRNVSVLKDIFQKAGFNVHLAMLSDAIKEPLIIKLEEDAQALQIETITREHDVLKLSNGVIPQLIILNNDLSDKIPDLLQGLSQPIHPPAELGWHQRLKSEHFHYYANVCQEFSQLLSIDPWFITPLFKHCGHIDFMQQEGLECVIHNVEQLLEQISQKYRHYQIPYQPFVIVKADAGTYGMAVMTVRNIDDIKNMNRKQRTKMATTKGGQSVNRVIIQEGVYTFETLGENKAVAEPVIYLLGEYVIGGFYRVHQGRGYDESLNAPGMHFEPLAFAHQCNDPHADLAFDACPNRLYSYGIIAKLSMLAAAREINDQVQQKDAI
jgi:glutamate--cysteine ligase